MDKCAVGGRKNEMGLWAGLSKKLFFKFPPPFGVLPLLILDLMILDFRHTKPTLLNFLLSTFSFYLLIFIFLLQR